MIKPEIKIVYRNGLPTQKSLEEIFASFFGNRSFQIRASHSYDKKQYDKTINGIIIWQVPTIQEKMDAFIEYLNELGLRCGKYLPYESPRVGSLEILPIKK